MAIFQILNLTCGYQKDIDVIKNFSMNIEKGHVTSILGPNGAGKSTILKTIFGIVEPKEGKILFQGEEITRLPPYRMKVKGVSYIPQQPSFFPYLTVEENIKLGAWILRKDKEKVHERLEEVYKYFPILREKKYQKATFLSGGQLKMLEIAKGIVTDTKLLLIDEPTAGLAPKLAKQIYEWIFEFKSKATIVLVDQNIRRAVDISDYLYFIRLGENFCDGQKNEIKGHLDDIVRSCLVGD